MAAAAPLIPLDYDLGAFALFFFLKQHIYRKHPTFASLFPSFKALSQFRPASSAETVWTDPSASVRAYDSCIDTFFYFFYSASID